MQLDKSYASIILAAMAMHRGFDEHCSVFISPNHMQEVSRKALIVDGAVMDNQLLPIPTLEQIQRWLREKHKINVYCVWHLVDTPPFNGVWIPFMGEDAITYQGSKLDSIRYVQEESDYYDALAFAVHKGLLKLQDFKG